jgi:1-acyl-sn-glycerol-3-phosphate acyltransferase
MAMSRQLLRLLRAAALLLHTLLGALLGLLLLAMPARLRAHLAPHWSSWWLRRVAAILDIRVLVHGQPSAGPCLMAANHVSWLDILVLATAADTRFVAKAEISHWPVLGWLSRAGGTEFIARGDHSSHRLSLQRMTRRLSEGGKLLVFPEGTSHARIAPARFRPRLFQAAIQAKVPVQPVAIYYGSGADLERVACMDDDDLPRHLWALLLAEPVLAEVSCLPLLSSVGGDAKLLADEAWRAVVSTNIQFTLFESESRSLMPPPGLLDTQAQGLYRAA